MQDFTFNAPGTIVFGCGKSRQAGSLMRALASRVLVVTDPGLLAAGLAEPLFASLRDAGIEVSVFSDVSPDPAAEQVLAACRHGKTDGVAAVIGFGGGSPMDVAKLTALLLHTGQALDDIYGVGVARGPRLPLMLVPTTAGTGSEATPVAIVTTASHEKKGVVSPSLLPDIALLDPELIVGLPPAITAATGIDAMVHAIEAYTSGSPNNNPISRGLATQALSLLGSAIETAVHDGKNLKARSRMLLGSLLAGQAFANSPVAAVHALAYPLGGIYGVPHGLSNALMLPHVMRFNAQACAPAYADLAVHTFGVSRGDDTAQDCDRYIRQLEALISKLGITAGLRSVGVVETALTDLAAAAMKQTRLLVNNPRPVTPEDALTIYRAAW